MSHHHICHLQILFVLPLLKLLSFFPKCGRPIKLKDSVPESWINCRNNKNAILRKRFPLYSAGLMWQKQTKNKPSHNRTKCKSPAEFAYRHNIDGIAKTSNDKTTVQTRDRFVTIGRCTAQFFFWSLDAFFPSNARWLSPGRLTNRKYKCILQIQRIRSVATSVLSTVCNQKRTDWIDT